MAHNAGSARSGPQRSGLFRKVFMKRILLIATLLLPLIGCGTFSTLKTIVDVTESAIPIIQSAGVPIPAEVPEYVAAVANCIGSQTGTPNAQQILAISGCLLQQIAPVLGPGTPQKVVIVIAAINKAVSDYLAQNPLPPAAVPTPRAVKPPVPLSASDAAQFEKLRTRAAATASKAHSLAQHSLVTK